MRLTPEIVRELLDYNPETGLLAWAKRDRKWFSSDNACNTFNTQFQGKPAGCTRIRKNGYGTIEVRVLDKMWYAHRLAWMWMTDEPLPEEIDHINRDATDNRWVNLRAATKTDNQRNSSLRSDNTSGVTGVYWEKAPGKWSARIRVNNKMVFLGYFESKDGAIAARLDAEIKHGFDAHHGYPRKRPAALIRAQ